MKKLLNAIALAILLCAPLSVWAQMEIGKIPSEITLTGNAGGRLDGAAWISTESKDKVTVLFYVDPDEKDLNNPASEALKKEKFPLDHYQSYGIINMAATWLPNFAISSSLRKKQKKYPNTTYVRDYNKALVKQWGLTDDTSCVLAFDKNGKLIFRKDGLLDDQDIRNLISAVRTHLGQ